MRNFRELRIWQKGMELVNEVYDLAKHLPEDERFGLRSQCTRAAASIPTNIAEGCSRGDKELKHFCRIALGSAFELETQVLIIQTRNADQDFAQSLRVQKWRHSLDNQHQCNRAEKCLPLHDSPHQIARWR